MEKESILIKNIKYLVTCDENDQVYSHVNMYIEKGKISYIGSEGRKAKTIIDGTNFVVYPGLINTHHHLYQIFSRNLPEVQHMELFPWLRYLYEIWKNIDETTIYYATLIGAVS